MADNQQEQGDNPNNAFFHLGNVTIVVKFVTVMVGALLVILDLWYKVQSIYEMFHGELYLLNILFHMTKKFTSLYALLFSQQKQGGMNWLLYMFTLAFNNTNTCR